MTGLPYAGEHRAGSYSNSAGALAVCSPATMLPAATEEQACSSLVHFGEFGDEAMAAVSLIGFSRRPSTLQRYESSNEQSS